MAILSVSTLAAAPASVLPTPTTWTLNVSDVGRVMEGGGGWGEKNNAERGVGR